MPRALLIGYGNTLRGDDALGPVAIERLRLLLPEAELISCHQLGPELAERMAACDLAIFIDATCDGEPGAVHVERLQPAAEHSGSLTHHLGPAALLELAHALYGHAPQAMLVTGVGSSFESGEQLSNQACQALDEICRIVPRLLLNFPAMW